MRTLRDHKEDRILDLCCGTGEQLKLLSRNGFSDLHCLDISAPMLRIARKGGKGRIQIYNEDATRTKFPDESFDIIILSLALHEKDPLTGKLVLEEAHRLLREEGLLVLVDFEFDDRTSRIIKAGIYAVEWIAGREHFLNFKEYTKGSGMASLMETKRFVPKDHERALSNGISIRTYNKGKER